MVHAAIQDLYFRSVEAVVGRLFKIRAEPLSVIAFREWMLRLVLDLGVKGVGLYLRNDAR